MFNEGDSSNKQKISGCSIYLFNQVLQQNVSKMVLFRGFYLKPTKRP